MVTIMAMRDLDGEVPSRADFTGYCEGFAGGFFDEDQALADIETVLPESLDDSLGYWTFKEGTGSIAIICSRHNNDALYVFLLLSADKDPKTTQALLAGIASDVLDTDSPYPTASSLESLIGGFSDERPMTDLPGPDDLRAGHQFVDKDYLVMK